MTQEVSATVETDPVHNSGDAADDPAIWIHPTDPSLSTVIGTDKCCSGNETAGGLVVYDLDGNELFFHQGARLNNVDVRYNFPLGGELVDIVGASNREEVSSDFYKVNPDRSLTPIGSVPATSFINTARGFTLYHSPVSEKFYAFITDRGGGNVEQFELDGSTGTVTGTLVRQFNVNGGPAEGLVTDDELGILYAAEEDIGGIWRYGAEPGDGTTGTVVDSTSELGGNLIQDTKGLAIYYGSNGSGYLIAASQGNGTFQIYDRQDNSFLGEFEIVSGNGIDSIATQDGIDVTNAALGGGFPEGLFVSHDNSNDVGNQNFKLVPWEVIAQSFTPSLLIDTSFDPRSIGGGTPTPTVTGTPPTDTPTNTPTPTPQTTTLTPIQDTYVDGDQPSSNFGLGPDLRSDASPLRETHLTFDLASLSGQNIVFATLRMFVTNGSGGSQSVKEVADTSWTETTMTYDTRPAKGTLVASFTPGSSSAWREVDITSAVASKAGSLMSLAIDSTASDGYAFNSKDAAVNQVELVVGVSGPTGTPEATPTTTSTVTGTPATATSTSTPAPTVTPTETPTVTATPTATPTPGAVSSFTAEADARVHEVDPTGNFGSQTSLRVEGGSDPDIEAYLRFSVTGISGVVQSATLRLTATSDTVDGPQVKGTTNGWGEGTITWDSRPPPTSGAVDEAGAISPGTVVELDVTSLVGGNGTYSFVLVTDSSDGVSLSSREGATPPELVIVAGDGGTSTSTSTATSTPSATLTASQTPTATATPTPTATATPTATPTIMPTSTPTTMPTDTPTSTQTPAPTATLTPIATNTPATTPAATLTAIPTESSTPTPTAPAATTTSTPTATVSPIPTPTPQLAALSPTEDAYVAAGSPDGNFGSSADLRSDASPLLESFLTFDLQPFAGQTVSSATLRMFVTNRSSGLQSIKGVTDTSWSEASLTYNTRPAKGATITTFTPSTSQTWVEVDVTSAVAGNVGSLMAIAIDSLSSDGYRFNAKEASTDQVELLIEVTGPTATPTTTPTLTPTPTGTPPTATPTPQVLALSPADDAYVSASRPDGNFGSSADLWSDASPLRESFLTFDLQPFAGQTVSSATLRMFVTNGSNGLQSIKGVADTSWTEGAITYNTRPAKGATIATFTPSTPQTWVEVDITSAVAGGVGSLMAIAIDSLSSDGYGFDAKEATTNQVELLIEVSGPTPTPTATPTVTPTPTGTPATATPTPQLLALSPGDDAYVSASSPDGNFGSSIDLWSDASPLRESFLTFDLQPFAGQTISSATLRMFVTNRSNRLQSIKSVTDTSWSEASVTYNTRPAKGATVATFTPSNSLTWVEVDITSAVAGDVGSLMSIAIDSLSSDGYRFNAKEATTNQVELLIQLAGP